MAGGVQWYQLTAFRSASPHDLRFTWVVKLVEKYADGSPELTIRVVGAGTVSTKAEGVAAAQAAVATDRADPIYFAEQLV